jgi:hypothetical protein
MGCGRIPPEVLHHFAVDLSLRSMASALVRPALVLTAVCSARRWLDPEPTMVVECASCRPSCWLLGRARPSSVDGAGRGLNPPSSGAGGSGGGGITVKGGGKGECAEAVTATIPCRSPRAIDRRPQAPSAGRISSQPKQRPHRSAAAGPVWEQRESTFEREMGQHLGRGVLGVRRAHLRERTRNRNRNLTAASTYDPVSRRGKLGRVGCMRWR